ncbi:lysine-specific demethylase 3A-like isoform X2 [Paramacrobiotus metropolitanus]|uniref:lysine-specific demethylase 3A-like isoform X2 n=1 Tax=Paramacrobiotus metropolitanus TaxID=2943436 RepID=UPI0024463ED7|nr:lysine-specific demethylase 3A-like isoform X2 [Paramacrobiotus metropolitanus]
MEQHRVEKWKQYALRHHSIPHILHSSYLTTANRDLPAETQGTVPSPAAFDEEIWSEEEVLDSIRDKMMAASEKNHIGAKRAILATENGEKAVVKRAKRDVLPAGKPSFIQTTSCIHLRKPLPVSAGVTGQFVVEVPLCMDCFLLYVRFESDYRGDNTCRFRETNMRFLRPHEYLKPERAGGPSVPFHSLRLHAAVTETVSQSRSPPPSALYFIEPPAVPDPVVSRAVAAYILPRAAGPLQRVLKDQEADFNVYELAPDSTILKQVPAGFREYCDVCKTSIFDLHHTCLWCGFAVCGPCRKRRNALQGAPVAKTGKTGKGKTGKLVYNPDDLIGMQEIPRDDCKWPACCASSTRPLPRDVKSMAQAQELAAQRFDHNLKPTRMIPTKAVELIKKRCSELAPDELLPKMPIPSKKALLDRKKCLSTRCRDIADPWPSERHIRRIPAGRPDDVALQEFRDKWCQGDPVIVEGVHRRLARPDIWLPEYFQQRFGAEPVLLVDCLKKPQEQLHGKTHGDFWKGFTNYNERLRNNNGIPRLLKIKDWPTDASFREKLVDHYQDLMQALPINSYANIHGVFNLSRYLPSHFNPPDLGPKMYIAYGAAGQPKHATTNLHVDISDAVNVIVHVAKPVGEGAEESLQSTKEVLSRLNLDEETKRRLEDPNEVPGAVWQIFRAKDADTITAWLLERQQSARERRALAAGKSEPPVNPIHTQDEFLDEAMRERLRQDTHVWPFDIVQFEGDAIFIPAGAPHQVWNVHSCIKVAEDFVSPEHLAHCVSLTTDFSRLPDNFDNKADKLQIKNIVYQTVKVLAGVAE